MLGKAMKFFIAATDVFITSVDINTRILWILITRNRQEGYRYFMEICRIIIQGLWINPVSPRFWLDDFWRAFSDGKNMTA